MAHSAIRPAKLKPDDALWLEILLRRKDLRVLDEQETRRVLAAGGFPQRLVAAYLAERSRPKASSQARRPERRTAT